MTLIALPAISFVTLLGMVLFMVSKCTNCCVMVCGKVREKLMFGLFIRCLIISYLSLICSTNIGSPPVLKKSAAVNVTTAFVYLGLTAVLQFALLVDTTELH